MIKIIIEMIVGLILFFRGIKLVKSSIEDGNVKNYRGIIDKLIKNELIAAIVGVISFILGIISSIALQSGSLPAISALILVNCEVITLRQAFSFILGSMIGVQLTFVKLGIIQYILLFVLIAVILSVFIKSKNKSKILRILLEYCVLILGVIIMHSVMRDVFLQPDFMSVMMLAENSISNVLIGILIGALLWNPSTCIGICIAFTSMGFIDSNISAQIILGCSVSLCVPVLLASIVLNKEAKKTALSYLLLNVLIVFKEIISMNEIVDINIANLAALSAHNIILDILVILILLTVIGFVKEKIRSKSQEVHNN